MRNTKVEEYSNNNKSSYAIRRAIGGSLDKRFVRVPAVFYKDLFKELATNPKCSYKTYLNDFIKNDTLTSRYMPSIHNISALIKQVRENLLTYGDAEIIGSRLGNMLGIPVVYNKKILVDDMEYISSVDYVDYGKETLTLVHVLPDDVDFVICDDESENNLKKALIDKKYQFTDENWQQVLCGIAEIYLFKELMLEDDDLGIWNINLVYDRQNKIMEVAPACDMEFGIFRSYATTAYKNVCEDLMSAYAEKYPQVLNGFIEKIKKFNVKKFSNALSKEPIGEHNREIAIQEIKRNISLILDSYSNVTGNALQQ